MSIVIAANQHRMTRFAFGVFFAPKGCVTLLSKKGYSRLDLSEIPAHIYGLEANLSKDTCRDPWEIKTHDNHQISQTSSWADLVAFITVVAYCS